MEESWPCSGVVAVLSGFRPLAIDGGDLFEAGDDETKETVWSGGVAVGEGNGDCWGVELSTPVERAAESELLDLNCLHALFGCSLVNERCLREVGVFSTSPMDRSMGGKASIVRRVLIVVASSGCLIIELMQSTKLVNSESRHLVHWAP